MSRLLPARAARRWLVCVVLGAVVCASCFAARAEEAAAPNPKTFGEVQRFLAERTKVIELRGAGDSVVAVCPELQGRVMTSSCAGPHGASLGWVNFDFLRAGQHSAVFDNYGGEDRFWIGPEGGQFAVFFKMAMKQIFANWFVPPDIDTGAFQVAASDPTSCRLARRVHLTNASEASFDLDVQRTIRVLAQDRFKEYFGEEAARAVQDSKAKFVGFESENQIANVGPTDWDMQSGLLSIWSVGMFNANDSSMVVVPYKPGDEATLGPVVETSYFGAIAPDRLAVGKSALFFRGDGKFRSKLGIPAKRVRPIAGSVDLKSGVLTLVHFSLPDDPVSQFYVNNLWKLQQQDPYAGDVFNSYNDGPNEPGAKSMGSFYELETMSPARPLKKGEHIAHTHSTFHLQVDPAAIGPLLKATLGVDLQEVTTALNAGRN